MTKYTPVPWIVGIDCVLSDTEEVGDLVCDAPPRHFEKSRKFWDANARLIAAAPDMFAALKAFIADYENPAQTCHNGHTAEKARAAIAKAEP